MHLLVTRPQSDAQELKERLEALGHTVSVAPLLQIELTEISFADVQDAVGLIATSTNAMAALAASPDVLAGVRQRPLFAVGAATARRASALGFETVVTGPGTAEQLVDVIASHVAATSGPLVHLAGDHLAFDLGAALRALTIDVRVVRVYRSVAVSALPAEIGPLLTRGVIDGVILMSPRSSQTWQSVVSKLTPRPPLETIAHICLSNAVAAGLETATPLKSASATDRPLMVSVSERPTLESLLALVQRLATTAKTG